MMKKLMLFCSFALTFLAFGNAMAAFSFDISDAGNDGTYDLTFFSDGTPADALTGFNLEFGYDVTELSYTSPNVVYTVPSGFVEFFGPVDDTVSGQFTNMNAGSFSPSQIANGTTLATFTFGVIDPTIIQDTLPDLFFSDLGNFFVTQAGGASLGFLDLEGAGSLTYGANVDKGAPVPIPSTLLILGSGLVGLVGIGRKKRK